jgi:DNA-binding transcriptional regulator LsrR (DeoR family)
MVTEPSEVPGAGEASVVSEVERQALDVGDSEALLLAVARRYYHLDQSKVEIGKVLGLSRFQVARMLREARQTGVVRIEIGAPGRVDREMSAALAERLGIQRAVVVSCPGSSPHSRLEHVGRVLAEQVCDLVREDDVVGTAWSAATVVMSRWLDGLRRCAVVQLSGVVYPPVGVPGSVELARLVAAASGGQAHTLYAPLVVADVDTADGLRRQPEITAVLERMRSLDVAVLSVGAWRPAESSVYDLLDPAERDELAAAGVCGEVVGRLFDRHGVVLETALDQRVIGIDVHRLRQVPRLITSSHGAYRAEATAAAVRAGLVHTLVVDDELATALLAKTDTSAP